MNFSGPTLGDIMGTVFTVVLQVQCWWVQVQCLTSNTTAYTAPITAMSQFFCSGNDNCALSDD